MSRPADPARLAAFRTLRAVTADDAYANLALAVARRGYVLETGSIVISGTADELRSFLEHVTGDRLFSA